MHQGWAILVAFVVALGACAQPAEVAAPIERAPRVHAPERARRAVTAQLAAPAAPAGSATGPTAAPGAGSTPAPPAASPAAPVTARPATGAPVAPVPPATGAAVAGAATASRTWTTAVYAGFGAWLDVYDWSTTFSHQPVGTEAIDRMAAEGVQTLYIQASKWNSPTDVLEPERLRVLVDRARHHGIAVVAWYLPTLEDTAADLRRMLAIAEFGVDGIGIDIEATDVEDVGERNRRLVAVSAELRRLLAGRPIAAITLEPVLMEDVNPRYWPDFPWAEIAPSYDVWMPMSYWTNRRQNWRDAYRYSLENVNRIRARIGQPDAPVHLIGGIGDKTTDMDLVGMYQAGVEGRVIGGSLYDFRTTTDSMWERLRRFRR